MLIQTKNKPQQYALRLSYSLLLFLLAGSSLANMSIDRAILYFNDGKAKRQDVRVSNTGKQPLYVQVEVLKVENAGTEEEVHSPITDPRKKALIATPAKLIVPPGGRKQVRLVNLIGNDDKEHTYRVNLKPVAAPETDNSGGSKINILIGYQLLVFITPKKPSIMLEHRFEDGQLIINNTGNNNVFLANGIQCPEAVLEQTKCSELGSKRVYPGNEWRIDLPYQSDVTFEQAIGNNNSTKVFSATKK